MSIFFHKSRRTFYYRSHIPRPLRRLLAGRREVWRSLETDDKVEAKVRAASWDTRALQLYLTLRRQGEGMTEEERESLVAHWLEVELDSAENCRATAGRISDSKREEQLDGLDIMQTQAAEDLVDNDYRRIEKTAVDLLKSAGLSLDRDGADFGRLCRRLLQAQYEYTQIEMKRWNGEQPSIQRPLVNGASHGPVSSSASAKPTTQAPTGPLFSEVVESYFRENPRAVRSAEQTREEFKKFMAVIGGDRPVSGITKAEGRRYKDSLLNGRKVKLATAFKLLTTLSGLFRWCEKQGYIPENANPVRGLAPDKKAARKERQERKPFTDSELLNVFGSQEFKAQRASHPERYWVSLICLFEVCRRGEGAQLNVADVCEEDGIAYFRITNEGEGQGLKNEASKRRVPVHRSLIQLGFMGYLTAMKKAGHTRLFPQLPKVNPGDAVGKWFSLVTKLGLTDPGLVLHSLRHGGITKLHESGCPANIVEMLAGHAAANVHGQYVHRELIKLDVLRVLSNGLT